MTHFPFSNLVTSFSPLRLRARGLLLAAGMSLLLLSAKSTTFAGSAAWQTSPSSGDWNTATNWLPTTVPNGPSDTATFAFSNVTDVSLSAITEVNGVVFNPDASAFTITNTPTFPLTISGVGITNNSGITQHFVMDQNESGDGRGINFTNSATAGTATAFSIIGGSGAYGSAGEMRFLDSSSADHGDFEVFGSYNDSYTHGTLYFEGNATAGQGTFTINGA